MSVIDILEQLESNSSRLFKEELLEQNSKNKLLRSVLIASFDPYVNYYVVKFKSPKSCFSPLDRDDDVLEKFLELLNDKLSTRKLTGNAAKQAVEQFFMPLDERQSKWCKRILLKNLRCGVQETTINKIWPGCIAKFSVQLAETLASHFVPGMGIVVSDEVGYPIRIEPKLDGLRCIIVKNGGDVTMFTRSGSVIDTLPSIKASIAAAACDNIVLDGEVMGENWNDTASVVMSYKAAKNDSGMFYNVFDVMDFNDWRHQSNDVSLSKRVDRVADVVSKINQKNVVQVPGISATSEAEVMTFYAECMEKGYEGIMLKNLSSPYAFKRSKSVLKLKPVTTYEGVIVGHYEGRRGSKREGLWGGFLVLMPNGIVTKVGGGFTDSLKSEINLDPDSWVGQVIEVEGQPDPLTGDGLTKDGRVRFPVFIRKRDPRDVDQKVMEAYREYVSQK